MRNRTKFIISALLGSATLATAIPAQAQGYPQYGEGRYQQSRDYDRYGDRYDGRYDDRGQANAIRSQIEQLERRIQRNDGRDRISEREAANLRRAIYGLRQQYRDYSRNGLTRREAQVLQTRIQQIRERLHYERRDDDRRGW